MKQAWLLLLLSISFLNQDAIANDDLKIRQTIGKDVILFWYHNEPRWGSELLYGTGSKPWLLLGAGPNYAGWLGPAKIRVFGYLALKANSAKNQWSVEIIEVEFSVVPIVGKWIINIYSSADVSIGKSETTFFGRDFLGYQISPKWQPRLQAEWNYKDGNGVTQSLGLGWQRSLTATFNLDGYFGVETKKPYFKMGWFRLNAIF